MPNLEKVVKEIFKECAAGLRVCMPGRVEAYDADTQLATIQPLLKVKFYAREVSTLLPSIARVPVVHPRSANAMIRLPVAKGSIVTLVFADRSLENWLAGDGDPKEPIDNRKHHHNDAYAIPGGYPEKLPWPAANADALEVVVKAGTKMTFGNDEGVELLQLAHDAFTTLQDLCEQVGDMLSALQLETHTSGAAGNPTSVPLNISDYATVRSAVVQLKNDAGKTITDLEKIKI